MIPGRVERPGQRPHQAARARERRAQRRHVVGSTRRTSRPTTRLTPRTTSPRPWARTTAWPSSAGTTPTRRPTSAPLTGQPPGDGAFLVRNSWGSALGRGRLLLGLLLRRVVRPRPGPGRLRRRDVLLARRGRRQLLAGLPVRQARRHRPLGLQQLARVGRQPVHGGGRRRPSPPPASTRSARPPGTRSGPAARCGRSACGPPAPSELPGYTTVPLSSKLRVYAGRRRSWSRSSWSPPARRTPWRSSARRAPGCPAPRPGPGRASSAATGPRGATRRTVQPQEQCLHQGLRRVRVRAAAPA